MIVEYHGLSETYLAKHLQALTNSGILESEPGPRGGYRLTRPPEQITLLDVVETIDGREPLFRCTEIRQQGPAALAPQAYRLPCAIHVAMAQDDKAWRDALHSQTIADIINQYTQHASPQYQQQSKQWVVEHMRQARLEP
ncbi:MAG TPA: Rrf2 family transcriptional regulator [Ktedonobacterales bacterium]